MISLGTQLSVLAWLFLIVPCLSHPQFGDSIDSNGQPRSFFRSLGSRQTSVPVPVRGCVQCRISMFDTMFPDPQSNSTTSIEQTTCIVLDDGVETDRDFPILLPPSFASQYLERIETGTLAIEACGINLSEDSLIQYPSSSFKVIDDYRFRHLKVQPKNDAVGTKTLALISISTADSASSHTSREMADALMDAGKVNLRTQFDACSFGKLRWRLAPGGLVDVILSDTVKDLKNDAAVVAATQKYLKQKLNLNSVEDLADKVIMCLPPGTGNWAAKAGVNHWRVQMNDHWCLSLSGTIHELGHTLGLSHSNANGQYYADRSGYMGSGYEAPTWPLKCFNAYHSYQLGWYSDRTLTVSPHPNLGQLVELATFVDYDKLDWNNYVLINIANSYFMNFNVKKSFNAGSEGFGMADVTVIQPNVKGTDILAEIQESGTYTISNFYNGRPLVIEACRRKQNMKGGDVMVVSISMDKSLCQTNSRGASSALTTPTTVSGGRGSVMDWLREILALLQRG